MASTLLTASLAVMPATVGTAIAADEVDSPVCVYISSYHHGLEWSDRVEDGLRAGLAHQCRLVQYDMDTDRNPSDEFKVAAAAEALSIIQSESADIVLTSDDNAARYLIAPHLAGTRTPVVFTGIDWTVEEYGFPVENVTGMVEVSPLVPLIEQAVESVPGADRAAYLGAKTPDDTANFERYASAALNHGVELIALQSTDFELWKQDFDIAQEFDFVIIGDDSGIDSWDLSSAAAYARAQTRTLSLTNDPSMMPLSALGLTTRPEEQGEWAAESAVAILAGSAPSSIPIVTNREWDTWINQSLLEASGVTLPGHILDSARQVH